MQTTNQHKNIAHFLLPVMTLFFALGIILEEYLTIRLDKTALSTVGLSLTLLGGMQYYQQGHSLPTTLLLFLLAGYLHAQQATTPLSQATDLTQLIPQKSEVTLQATLAKMVTHNEEQSYLEVIAKTVRFPHASSEINTQGRVRLSLPGEPHDLLIPGDTLLIRCRIGPPHLPRAPGTFNYADYLARQHIDLSGTIKSPHYLIRLQPNTLSFSHSLRFYPEKIRHQTAQFLQRHLSTELSALYQALLIGNRASISPPTLEHFKIAGVMHLLAISGMHMSLLGLVLVYIIKRIMSCSTRLLLAIHVPSVAMGIAIIPLLFYSLIAGLNPPVLRALLMACLVITAILLRVRHHVLHIISLAVLMILLINPLLLFSASFQLSLAGVSAIALCQPYLPCRLTLSTALIVSTAASLGILPLALFYFNQFSLIGPMMNLIIEPLLCWWSLPIGILATIMIPLQPDIALSFYQLGSLGLQLALYLTKTCAAFPWVSLHTITPHPLEIFAYYLIIFYMFWGAAQYRKRITLSALFLLIISFTTGWPFFINKSLKVSYIDVGKGTSTLIAHPSQQHILIDGGSYRATHFDVGQKIIAPFLWQQRVWRLEGIVITHPHADHYNGLHFILRHFQPKKIWINHEQNWPNDYQTLLALATQYGIPTSIPLSGERLFKIDHTTLLNLSPSRHHLPHLPSINDRSLVTQLIHHNVRFLFPSDIAFPAEKQLVRHNVDLKAHILLAPHHGSTGSGSQAFLKTVNPDVIIISTNRLAQQHPLPLKTAPWLTLSTAEYRTIQITSDGQRYQIIHWLGDRWQTQIPHPQAKPL